MTYDDFKAQWARNEVELVIPELVAKQMLESVPLRFRLKAYPWHTAIFVCVIGTTIATLFMPFCLVAVVVLWSIGSVMPKPKSVLAVRAYALANPEFFNGLALYGLMSVTDRQKQD